jgi:heat-inducible transcriptional repressor
VRSSTAERERRVLDALVRLYIERREPISSRMIEESEDLGVRSASIRSVLAELERKGYLYQPHPSAGRIPTDEGYRAYVDQLLPTDLSEEETQALQRGLREAGEDITQLLRGTARLLSRFTRNIALVGGPREKGRRGEITGVELYDRGGGHVLVVVSLGSGAARTELVTLERDVKPGLLVAASAFLAERLTGRSLEECRRDLEHLLGVAVDEARTVAVDVADRAREIFHPGEVLHFTFEGVAEALQQPEFADPERLKRLLEVVARHELFEQALEDFVGDDRGRISLAIGRENPLAALHPFTLVAMRYELGGATGYLGILGPRRMRYARTLALIQSIAGYLESLDD